LCTACGRFSEIKSLKKTTSGWKHLACDSMPSTFGNKVLCVVCGMGVDEKSAKLRKSGFKCKKCVGTPHRSEVLDQIPELKRSDTKRDSKRVSVSKTITQTNCIICNLKLQVPLGSTLLTCPSCKTISNPYDRDLRFMKCVACHTLLQFSLQLARMSNSSQPIITCGQCKTPNDIPRNVLRPQPHPQPETLLVTFGRNGDIIISAPKMEQKVTSSAVIGSLPVHNYRTPSKKKEGDNDNTECSFCLSEFVEGEKVKTLPCFHIFHQTEIDKWLLEHTECPLCKTSVL